MPDAAVKQPFECADKGPTGLDDIGGSADASPRTSWPERAHRVQARAFEPSRGRELFAALWQDDRHGMTLTKPEVARLSAHFEFVLVPAAQQVIDQDEAGDYLLMVLEGRLAVDRVPGDGARTRLSEARAGDLLGEMALLDAGARFSACTTLTPCVLAVLDAHRLDALMAGEPRLALALLASLARRLSLRLRQVSTRVSALLAGG